MERLIVPATLESLEAIRKRVREAGAVAGLDKQALYRLVLAVDEVATNIVTHGYSEAGREGDIEVDAEVDAKSLTVTLRDTGPAFDPTGSAEPDFSLPVQERKIGGMGLHLAIRGVDKFFYQRAGVQNTNVFVMSRSRSAAGE